MALQFECVTFSHPSADSSDRPVLEDISFAIEDGGYVMVRGESGAGKSTLLRLACRLEMPASGRIIFKGRPVEEYDPPELRRRLAYVPQTPAVAPGSVRDNLLLPFSYKVHQDVSPPDDPSLRLRLEEFRLDPGMLERPAEQLSVGQKQRVCLIRTLLTRPEMLLMDEPASALDQESAEVVMRTAERLNREQGTAVMVVTHTGYTPEVPHSVLEIRNRSVKME